MMRIAFFGSSDFALPSLEAIYNSIDNEVVCVITQPDRKRGRGLRVGTTPIKDMAVHYGIEVFQPAQVNSPESVAYLRQLQADVFCIVAFGQIFSQELLDIPKQYALSVHGSLLPAYRGAAPIGWALINGEKEVGVTLFKVARSVDAGDIILQRSIVVAEEETAVDIARRLSRVGAQVFIEGLDALRRGTAVYVKQNMNCASRAPKFCVADGCVDWNKSARDIVNLIRGIQPWPGAHTIYQGKRLKIWRACLIENPRPEGIPGTIIEVSSEGIIVAACDGAVLLTTVQGEGGKRLPVKHFIVGHQIKIGDIFG